jgi:hypothetical protein
MKKIPGLLKKFLSKYMQYGARYEKLNFQKMPQNHKNTKSHKKLVINVIMFCEFSCFSDFVAKKASRSRLNIYS